MPTRVTPPRKLVVPPVPETHLSRPRIAAALDDPRRALVLVVGAPGFGKTAELAAWARLRGHRWYTLDARDADPEFLTAGMRAALAPAGTRAPVRQRGGVGCLSTAAAELTELTEPDTTRGLTLVLDNADRIPEASPGRALLNAFCDDAPAGLRIVVASRADTAVHSQRLRGRGTVADVDAGRLAFTAAETAAVLTALIGPGDAGLATAVHELTGGWPAAVRILAETLRPVAPARRLRHLPGLVRRGGALADYLAEEGLTCAGPEAARLLRAAGALAGFTAAMGAEAGFAVGDPGLARLVRSGLLVPVGTGAQPAYRVAPLVAAVHAADPDHTVSGRAALGLAAARMFSSSGRLTEGLAAVRAACTPAAVAGYLAANGDELLAGGAALAVIDAVAALPAELLSPVIHAVAGHAHQIHGDWRLALRHYRKAVPPGGRPPLSLAWRTGLIHYLSGNPDEALAAFQLCDSDAPAADSETAVRSQALSWAAAVHWRRQDAARCGEAAGRSLALAEASGDDSALAAAHTSAAMAAALAGDRTSSDTHYGLARRAAERAGDVLALVRLRNNAGSRLLEDGRYGAAITEFDEVIRLTGPTGWRPLACLALHNRGLAQTGLGRLDEARGSFTAALAGYRDMGSRMTAYPLMRLGDVYRARGEVEWARAAYEQAVADAEAAGDAQGSVPALAGLARILAATEPDAADALIARALAVGDAMARVEPQLAAGWIALCHGDDAAAAGWATQALAEARRRHHKPRLAEALELAALATADRALLAQAAALWREIGDPLGAAVNECLAASLRGRPAASAEHRLRVLGVPLASAAHAAGPLLLLATRTRACPVVVHTLGGFLVVRDAVPVPGGQWRSRKAREVLMVLIARRGGRVSREVLGEALWPGEDADRVANRLSVALSALRAVLDPHRSAPSDHYVRGDKDAVCLAGIEVDVLSFLDAAGDGLRRHAAGDREIALRVLAAAEAGYLGDFLEDEPYADWAVPLREEARAAYLRIVRVLADEATAAGATDEAVHYLLRLVERDPYDEAAQRRLVDVYRRAGRYGEARRRADAYQRLLLTL